MVDFQSLPAGEDAPRVVNAVIEVPVGSRNKYEYEPELGAIMRELEHLPSQSLREIEQFFEVYKQLEEEKHVEVRGWQGLDEAHETIRRCIL